MPDLDFRQVLDVAPNPYVILDRDLHLVWMNRAYLQVTGRTREEIVGRTMFEAFPSDEDSRSYKQLRNSFDRVLDTGKPDEIALIRYDIVQPDGTMKQRYWSATHTPFLDEEGRVKYILQHTVDVTELEARRSRREDAEIVRRAGAVEQRNEQLTERWHELQLLIEQAPGFISILQGADHRIRLSNATGRALAGDRPVIDRTFAEAHPDLAGQGFVDLLDQVHRSGEAFIGQRHRIEWLDPATGEATTRYLDFIFQPIMGKGGRTTGIFMQGHDVTEEVKSQRRQKLLIDELNHRVKNMLAIVQGLAMQSFRDGKDHAEARKAFDDRLGALAQAHGMLTDRNWEESDLEDLLTRTVEASLGVDRERVRLRGEPVELPPQTAISMALVIHELTTNAIKYGALSNDQGTVTVEWRVEEEGEDGKVLHLHWSERGGPPVAEPDRPGFGTRLIRRGFSSFGKGTTNIDYDRAGLQCRMKTPLE